MTPPRRESFGFFCRQATRWADVDRLGHINNAKYLTYEEQARVDYFEQRLGTYPDPSGARVILARMACDYLVQLHHPALMDYGLRVTRIGRTSLHTEGALFVGEHCHARTEGVLVWFDFATQKPVPIPDALRLAIRRFEPVKPAE